MHCRATTLVVASLLLLQSIAAVAQQTAGAKHNAEPSTQYRLSFPDAIHHVMRVEVTFRKVAAGTFCIQMSRSSPGRYAAFEFAKNVFGERITDGDGRALTATRPNPREWDVVGHHGTVQITYEVFGDRVDGTFLAVDSTHAHINFPATLMWAHGFTNYSAQVTFVLPPASNWKIATQLYPTTDPFTFTAPNLEYLMDSPAELSNFALRTFTVSSGAPGSKIQTVRIAMHHQGSNADLDAYSAGVERIVREEQAIFGELPDFEPGYYTLLADYLPWDAHDGMEHRNSAVVSGRSFMEKGKPTLGNAAHEFFHCWNVRRIRPATLEPFSFKDVNMSGELWLAEGFTSYYARLAMLRSGTVDLATAAGQLAAEIGYVTNSPGARFRSPIDMSRLAPFTDSQVGAPADPDDWVNTFVSYYSMGDVIALELDLTLRARSESRITLDDFMRAMWRVHGKPGGPAPGLVRRPYTAADVRARLAQVSRDESFADDFVRRYIEGTEHIDIAPLLLRAGLILRKKSPGHATLGPISLEKKEGTPMRVASPTLVGSPAYSAGLDLDDELISVAGLRLESTDDLSKAIANRRPGEEVELVFERRGQEVHAKTELAEDKELELVTIETTGAPLTPEQRLFREAWLSSKVVVR